MFKTELKETDEGLFLEIPKDFLDKNDLAIGDEIELSPMNDGILCKKTPK